MIIAGKTELLGEKSVPVPHCPLKIPHGMAWDQTQAFMVPGKRQTAWTIAQPQMDIKKSHISTKKIHSTSKMH
jgi:hypothetical protein